jgi:lipopolysaccharide export LptBFGC system permease protein LptF
MVFTLHRYVLWELIKVFTLASVALTLMLSLGSLLRPIQNYGVGPEQALRLLSYLLPITLTFVLPIAAIFAASLVYGRFASDNELDACRASGIGLWTLIYPGLVLAILVAITNLFLSFYVVPNYVHRAEKAVKADAKQILFRNLQRKGSYELPGHRIHADAVNLAKNELEGIVIAETGNKPTKKIITARRAQVDIEAHKNFNQIMITAYDVYQFDEQGQVYFKNLRIGDEMGSLLSDNIKFKKIDEIKRIRSDPMQFSPIAKLATQTYLQLVAELFAAEAAAQLAQGAEMQLRGDNELVRYTATACNVKKDAEIELSGNVVVSEYDNAQKTTLPDYVYRSSRAVIKVEDGPAGIFFEMIITGTPEWTRPDGTKGWSSQHIIKNLSLPSSVGQKLGPDILKTVAAMPTLLKQPSPDLVKLHARLKKEIECDMTDIDVEINSRLVFGVGCIVLILIGAGLGIILKGGHLLTAFGASAIPAAALIVCIAMGRNLAFNRGDVGILLMWCSLLVLTLLAAALYRKLLKA